MSVYMLNKCSLVWYLTVIHYHNYILTQLHLFDQTQCTSHICLVSPEDSVLVSPVDMVSNRGENVSFTCTSMGGPKNIYSWAKSGENIANDSVVTLIGIDASSGGVYTCTVSNFAGNDSATTTLYVAPYFVTHPENVETSNSSEVNITCEAESFPSPQYVWLKNGVAEMVRVDVVIADIPNTLGFRPVIFGDEGMYTCVASITIGMAAHNESSNSAVLTGTLSSRTYC